MIVQTYATLSLYFASLEQRDKLLSVLQGSPLHSHWRAASSKDGALHSIHLSSEQIGATRDIADHLIWLERASNDLDVLLNGAPSASRVVLWIYTEVAAEGNAGMSLPSSSISWLARLGAEVVVDLWPEALE